MRILALVTEAYGGSGGIAQANRDLFDALSETNEIFILPRKFSPERLELTNRIQKKASTSKLGYILECVKTVLSGRRFELIFCGHLFMAPLAWFVSRMSKKPYWLHIHGIEAWKRPSAIVGLASEKATLITSVSRYTRRLFLAWANVSPEKVRVVPDTVEERFTPGPKPESLMEKYGLSKKKVLLTVGRLSSEEKYKGHDKVISILPQLIEKYPDIIYAIAGDGSDRSRLEALAKEKNVQSQVIFLGFIEKATLPDVYRMADVYVMPSSGEGFGIAFLEAAACGIPLVGGGQGCEDALIEGRAGRLVDPTNEKELFDAICDSLEKKENLGEASCFSKPNFSEHVTGLIERMSPCRM